VSEPIVFGAVYSVYTRSVLLTLTEKGVAHRLEEIDIFTGGGPPPAYLARHPFVRIPAFEHDGFRLYESGAINRYVDEAFPGPRLQPADAKPRARMNQIIAILDNYAYRAMVWDIFVERVRAPARGRAADEQKVAAALPVAEKCLGALAGLMDRAPYLAGPEPTLADLHAAPMLAYFRMAPEGAAMLRRHDALQRWWDRMAERSSIAAVCRPI
jgi:glutathione S-transferase